MCVEFTPPVKVKQLTASSVNIGTEKIHSSHVIVIAPRARNKRLCYCRESAMHTGQSPSRSDPDSGPDSSFDIGLQLDLELDNNLNLYLDPAHPDPGSGLRPWTLPRHRPGPGCGPRLWPGLLFGLPSRLGSYPHTRIWIRPVTRTVSAGFCLDVLQL